MDHNPDRIAVWPGYFDAKVSRRSGRRVPRDSSVLKPDLEGLFIASRAVGLRKIKREERVSHPNRPHAKEGDFGYRGKGQRNLSELVAKRKSCNLSEVSGAKCKKTRGMMRKRLKSVVQE